MRPSIERCRCRCIARRRKLREVSIAEGALRNEARRRKEGRYVDADQIIKTLLALLSLAPPPDRTGPGRLHAGWMRVDWVARKRCQEAA